MTSKEDIAKRIKEARKAQNLNQEEISAKMGIARNTFSQYEGGKASMSMEVFVKFLQITGISADWILFGKEGQPSDDPSRFELNKHLDSLNELSIKEVAILVAAYIINHPNCKK